MARGASDGCEGSPVWECGTQTVPDVYLRGDGAACEPFQIRRSSPVCSHSPPWPRRNTEGPLVWGCRFPGWRLRGTELNISNLEDKHKPKQGPLTSLLHTTKSSYMWRRMTAHIFFFIVQSRILSLEVYMQIQRHSGCANAVHHQGKMDNFFFFFKIKLQHFGDIEAAFCRFPNQVLLK